jgi:benzoate/toluate 1,2-dioxygenase alpha subunit
MGLKPLISGERSEDEGLFVVQHEYWVKAMRAALQKEQTEALA